jgi:acyl-CoA synthetase (AMP-forming)/AMP-acid ligase II
MSPPSLFGALARWADQDPDRPIFRYIEGSGETLGLLTRAGLVQRASALSGALDAQGEPVMLCAGPGEEQAVGLFGIWAAGAVAVPVYPPAAGASSLDALAKVARASGAKTLLAPASLLAELTPAMAERLGPDAPASVPIEAIGAPRVVEAAEPALILYTSGSTGDPKGVIIRHDAFLGNMEAFAAAAPTGALNVIGTWLPHAHIAGLYTRLLGVVTGGEAVVLAPQAFSRTPMA